MKEMVRNYKRYNIYYLSYNFALEIYKLTEYFPKNEWNGLSSQMRRASVSIPANIAEGSTRKSEREFLYFLNLSFGSGKELEFLLSFAKDVGYVDSLKYAELNEKLNEVVAKIFMFKKRINDYSNAKFSQKINQDVRAKVAYGEERRQRIVGRLSEGVVRDIVSPE